MALLAVALVAACGDGSAPTPPEMGPSGDTMAMDTGRAALTDTDIRRLAQADSTWTWWEFSDTLLDRGGNSPHADRIRVRYDRWAATQLDSAGRVRVDADFPDSSSVVKEVYSQGVLTSVLVMHKAVGDPGAGHGSWLWGEYAAGDGSALHSIADDNGSCHNCHVGGVDHMRMNDSH